jgi:hypothetical protein
MGKRGQVTLFVIIAIVIVAAVVIIYLLRDTAPKTEAEEIIVSSEIAPVKNLVDSCIEGAVRDSVYLIGEGGGYIYPPYGLSDVDGYSYYFLDGEVYFPEMGEIERRLSDNVRADVHLCVDEFRSFSNMNVEDEDMEVGVKVYGNRVVFDIVYPLAIGIGKDISYLKDFGEFEVESRLGDIYYIIDELINNGAYERGFVCISCFLEAGFVNNLTIDFLDGRDFGSVFVIKDQVVEIEDEAESEGVVEVEEEVFKWIFAAD